MPKKAGRSRKYPIKTGMKKSKSKRNMSKNRPKLSQYTPYSYKFDLLPNVLASGTGSGGSIVEFIAASSQVGAYPLTQASSLSTPVGSGTLFANTYDFGFATAFKLSDIANYTSYITNDYNEAGKICSTISPECQEKRYEIFDAKIFLNACGIDYYEVVKSDKPTHYQTDVDFDVIDFCNAYDLNFNRGSVVKYVARAGKKDDEIKDLEKALDFIQREIKYLKEK